MDEVAEAHIEVAEKMVVVIELDDDEVELDDDELPHPVVADELDDDDYMMTLLENISYIELDDEVDDIYDDILRVEGAEDNETDVVLFVIEVDDEVLEVTGVSLDDAENNEYSLYLIHLSVDTI